MRKLDNRGGTMVEIIVGFALILIIIASFMQIIKLSSNMTMYSVDENKKLEKLQEEYYSLNTDSFSSSVVAGYNETSSQYIDGSQIKLVECDKNGNVVNSTAKKFNLSNASLVKFYGNNDTLADLILFRMRYINRNPVTEETSNSEEP